MKLKKMPVVLVGFLVLSMGMVYALDTILKPVYNKTTESKKDVTAAEETKEAEDTKNDTDETNDTKDKDKNEADEDEKIVQEVAPLDRSSNGLVRMRDRMEKYTELYKKKKEAKRRKLEQKIIDEINSNAYTGDDSYASRRLYLLEQAYKRARKATPVIPLGSDVDDELLVRAHKEEDDELDTDTLAVVYSTTAPSEAEEEKE